MELDAEDRLEPGPDAFVGAVVEVHEPGLPVARKGTLVHRVAVVLAGDVAAARADLLHRLVHAAMTVRELVRVAARGEAEDLVAEADAEDREVGALEQQPHLLNELAQVLRVAGAVADQDAVHSAGETAEVGVPRRAGHPGPALEERSDYVVLGAGVHEEHVRPIVAAKLDRLLRRDQAEQLALHLDTGGRPLSLLHGAVAWNQPAAHRPVLAKPTGEGAGIDPGDRRDALTRQPVAQRARRSVMAGQPIACCTTRP